MEVFASRVWMGIAYPTIRHCFRGGRLAMSRHAGLGRALSAFGELSVLVLADERRVRPLGGIELLFPK